MGPESPNQTNFVFFDLVELKIFFIKGFRVIGF